MKLILKVLNEIVETDDLEYLLLFMGLGCLGCLVRNFVVVYTAVSVAIVVLVLCRLVKSVIHIVYLLINQK